MPAKILDGRALAADLRTDIRNRSEGLRARGIVPRLVVVVLGDDGASRAYVDSLVKVGRTVGIDVGVEELNALATEEQLRARLTALGDDAEVHGIILQQPLPPHLDIHRIADAMPPAKDVDGTNPVNLGRLAFGTGTELVPATPAAVMLLLERSARWPLRGVRACVVGRSSVVGLPLFLLMMRAGATLTVTHRQTVDALHYMRDADVLVVATGVPRMIRAEMVKPGATVIDVGTTFVDGKIVGDVAFDEVAAVAGEITPVPGGVGPVTNVALMRNVLLASERAEHVLGDRGAQS